MHVARVSLRFDDEVDSPRPARRSVVAMPLVVGGKALFDIGSEARVVASRAVGEGPSRIVRFDPLAVPPTFASVTAAMRKSPATVGTFRW